jgi:hypothetical protein
MIRKVAFKDLGLFRYAGPFTPASRSGGTFGTIAVQILPEISYDEAY